MRALLLSVPVVLMYYQCFKLCLVAKLLTSGARILSLPLWSPSSVSLHPLPIQFFLNSFLILRSHAIAHHLTPSIPESLLSFTLSILPTSPPNSFYSSWPCSCDTLCTLCAKSQAEVSLVFQTETYSVNMNYKINHKADILTKRQTRSVFKQLWMTKLA